MLLTRLRGPLTATSGGSTLGVDIYHPAGVSPATIYIYYDSKEALLSAAFREYSYQSYQYVDRRIRPGMGAAELIEAIVQGCYTYTESSWWG